MIRDSKSCALHLLKLVEPLGGNREHYNNAYVLYTVSE